MKYLAFSFCQVRAQITGLRTTFGWLDTEGGGRSVNAGEVVEIGCAIAEGPQNVQNQAPNVRRELDEAVAKYGEGELLYFQHFAALVADGNLGQVWD